MKIITRKISDLIEAEYNPRQLSEDQARHLKDSLTRFGFVDPVIVNTHKDRKNIIVGGHMRCRVWEQMGNSEVPTVEVKLTPEKERELNIRLNKNTGNFDYDLLSTHFETNDLLEWGFEEWEFGFSPSGEGESKEESNGNAKTKTCPECGHEWE